MVYTFRTEDGGTRFTASVDGQLFVGRQIQHDHRAFQVVDVKSGADVAPIDRAETIVIVRPSGVQTYQLRSDQNGLERRTDLPPVKPGRMHVRVGGNAGRDLLEATSYA